MKNKKPAKKLPTNEKTLFDHLKMITEIQDPNYFDTLTDKDKKTFSNFMIQRFLSMNSEWVEFISEMDPVVIGNQLKPELAYKLYISMIPKSKVFLKYVKSASENKFNKELVDVFRLYFETSKEEAIEYLTILSEIDKEHLEVIKILEMHAYDEKQIKKLI